VAYLRASQEQQYWMATSKHEAVFVFRRTRDGRRRPRHGAVPITGERLFSLIAESGGFTIRRSTGRGREHSVCVATRPQAELSFLLAEWPHDVVDRWLESLHHERRWRASHLGGWFDPESAMVVLDVVRVIPCRLQRMAFVVGKITRQEYAFNLSERRVMVLR
jgi:hypothetical protein